MVEEIEQRDGVDALQRHLFPGGRQLPEQVLVAVVDRCSALCPRAYSNNLRHLHRTDELGRPMEGDIAGAAPAGYADGNQRQDGRSVPSDHLAGFRLVNDINTSGFAAVDLYRRDGQQCDIHHRRNLPVYPSGPSGQEIAGIRSDPLHLGSLRTDGARQRPVCFCPNAEPAVDENTRRGSEPIFKMDVGIPHGKPDLTGFNHPVACPERHLLAPVPQGDGAVADDNTRVHESRGDISLNTNHSRDSRSPRRGRMDSAPPFEGGVGKARKLFLFFVVAVRPGGAGWI